MGLSENPAPHHETPAFGNPDLPPEGMVNTIGDPAGTKMTGPRNPVLESQFPNAITGLVRAHPALRAREELPGWPRRRSTTSPCTT